MTTALFIAPLATPLVLWLGELILDYPGRIPSGLSGSLMVNLAIALPVAYLAELVLGIPVWKVFVKFRVASPLAFLACGAAIGIIPALFLPQVKPVAAALCAVAGASSALVFRLVLHGREIYKTV